MNCPRCSQLSGRVVESRPFEGRQRRRYRCEMLGCKHMWNTVEVLEEEYQAVEEVRLFRGQVGVAGPVVGRMLALHDELKRMIEATSGTDLGVVRRRESKRAK